LPYQLNKVKKEERQKNNKILQEQVKLKEIVKNFTNDILEKENKEKLVADKGDNVDTIKIESNKEINVLENPSIAIAPYNSNAMQKFAQPSIGEGLSAEIRAYKQNESQSLKIL
jgi:hypothetical protein